MEQTLNIIDVTSKIALSDSGFYEAACVIQVDENTTEKRNFILTEKQIQSAIRDKVLTIKVSEQ